MNQGGNSTAETSSEGLPPPTLATSDQTQIISSPTETPSQTTTRRPRFGTSSNQRKFGGALAARRKWPPRRVSFPSNDTHLVTGYLEPANPWEYAENVNREDLISTYRNSCLRHNTEPLESVLAQLEKLEITHDRCDTLSLNGQTLEQGHCESLEEILKRVQFHNISLEETSIDDESCVALFDMMEYYESAVHVNISSNQNIGTRGWQACSQMIKKTQCLEQLEAKNVTLNEQHMPILSRALRIASHLQVLKLENCGLSGRPTIILVAALKLNTGLKELYLADNDLGPQDAMQLGVLLRTNNHLQLLDVSNNNVQDSGVGHISDGLIEQRIDDKDGKGLGILVLWNNHITRNSSQHFSRAITRCKSLEMLNIGQNMLTNDTLHIMKESLQQNRTLLRLGMQSTHLTCEAAIALADIIAKNHHIQRIDLRDNHLQVAGLVALAYALKKNKSVTQLDLDEQPRKKLDGTLEQYLALVNEIRSYCTHNDEPSSTDESTEESDSPQHRSRLSSVSSRKISLTCQTLPRSPPPIFPEGPGRTLLEPKRTSGGRLRSPAPSPIPSPVASPIPSPSRGRFVVSRVSETSLSSNSSASSSPVTPPSRSSSPTCFFPPATGASRFRVTVVEQANPKPAPKSVITSTNTNVTVGFQFKVDSGDQANSDDSDDVFKPNPDANVSDPIATKNKPDVHVSPSVNPSSENMTHLSEVTVKVERTGEMRCVVKDIITDVSNENPDIKISTVSTSQSEKQSEPCILSERVNRLSSFSAVHESTQNDVDFDFSTSSITSLTVEEKNDRQVQISNANQNSSTSMTLVSSDSGRKGEDALASSESAEDSVALDNGVLSQSRSRKSSCIQKPPSSLEKLLGLFQHPGSLFSSSASVEKLELKNPLQSGVSNMMSLGDKFHQYLREGRGSRECSPQPPLQRSVSDAPQSIAKTDPVKSSSVPHLSSIQALTSVFASAKLEDEAEVNKNTPLKCLFTLGKNIENPEQCQEDPSNEFENNTNDKTPILPQCKIEDETLHRISEQPLPENVQSKIKDKNRSDDLELKDAVEPNTTVLDSNETVNNVSVNMLDNKLTISVPKLKDIPEYSVLEISEIEVEPGGIPNENTKIVEEVVCDSSTTDSINLTSDRNSSPRNIICDKQNVVNVVTLGESEIVDILITPLFERTTKNVSLAVVDVVDNLATNLCQNDDARETDRYSNNSKIEDLQEHHGNMNLIENRITDALYNIDGNNEVTGSEQVENIAILHSIHTDNSEKSRDTNTCHLDNILHPESTTIQKEVHSSTPVLGDMFKDNVSNIENGRVSIRNNSLLRDEQIENCIDIILKSEPVLTQHQFSISQSPLRLNEDSSQNDAAIPMCQASEMSDPTRTNSNHQDNVIEEITGAFGSAEGSVEFDRSDGDELIFSMTDISIDATLEDYVLPLEPTLNQSNDLVGIQRSNSSVNIPCNKSKLKPNMPQAVQSPTSLFIEKSKGVHRNSHDSGIEETNLSMSADSISESRVQEPLFQESTESGIDTEWSFTGGESDLNNELIKDDDTKSTEKDTINNNKDNISEFNEAFKDVESCKVSNVSTEVSTKEGIMCRTVAVVESHSSMENIQTMVVTSICSRDDHGKVKAIEGEKSIEELSVEVCLDGRDNETSGCPAVVCSTSPQ
ncbi:uncharacterized protein LOC105685173 [Athalia rosae]|uniref:uncharacterized protein LOC105685173 n=1 Tax=Athalia rosae TaxID=37344 RepID=UPI0020347EF3|nr:uncharacterized protein LOC105685173 [Athalia rosae]